MRCEVPVFYTRTGRERVVVQEGPWPMKYPFKQMEIGDWFEVWADEVIGGNFVSLSSYWGRRLNRKFQARTIGAGKDAKYRVTRLK